jgi:hypothetical protein
LSHPDPCHSGGLLTTRHRLKTTNVNSSDKVYQLLDHGRWFSPGTPASPTTKTGRHDIAEILLKVALNTKIQIQIHSNQYNNMVVIVWDAIFNLL